MEEKSRRDLIGLLGGAAVAATLLSKTRQAAAVEPPRPLPSVAKQYMNITVAVAPGNDALLQKIGLAVQQAIGNSVKIGGVGNVSDGWDQTGGWVQDLTGGGWSQGGGWYLSTNAGVINKLTASQAATNTSLMNVRSALKAVQFPTNGQAP